MLLKVPSHPDLKRIVVINPKGGSGKSTLATNLAGYLAGNGYPPALMDFDPQGSALRWLQNRPKDRPPIHGIAATERNRKLTRSYQMRIPHHIRHVVIDTPAALPAHRLIDFTRGAHAILVPVLPSDIDIHAVTRLIADLLVIAKLSRRMGRLGVVANRVRENTLGYRKLTQFLERLSIAVVGEVRDSQNYVHAADQGIGIHEMQPSKVRKDLDHWQPILAFLADRLQSPLTPRDMFVPAEAQAAELIADPDFSPASRPIPEHGRVVDSSVTAGANRAASIDNTSTKLRRLGGKPDWRDTIRDRAD